MAPILYMTERSPAARSVLLTAGALGVELERKYVDLSKNEQFSPEFLKINPQHSIPTLDDDGYILWDSHAINIYLVSKYGKDDSLYPTDIKKRGIVNQRLFFHVGFYWPRFVALVRPIVYKTEPVTEAKIDAIKEVFPYLNTFLENSAYIAGDQLTLADLSILASTLTIELMVPIDEEVYPNLAAWLRKMKKLPYYGLNLKGIEEMRKIIQEQELNIK